MRKIQAQSIRLARVIALLISFTSTTAFAADGPRAPIEDLKSASDVASQDLIHALGEESHLDAITPADKAPFTDLAAACRRPRNQFLLDMAVHLARHTQPESPGMTGEYDREIDTINDRLRLDITRMGETLAPKGNGIFLEANENLVDRPQSWNQALRQRAEWTVTLSAVELQVAQKARGSTDFSANYAAGLWTLIYCDYSAQGDDFVRAFIGHGGTITNERDASAIRFVHTRAQHQ